MTRQLCDVCHERESTHGGSDTPPFCDECGGVTRTAEHREAMTPAHWENLVLLDARALTKDEARLLREVADFVKAQIPRGAKAVSGTATVPLRGRLVFDKNGSPHYDKYASVSGESVNVPRETLDNIASSALTILQERHTKPRLVKAHADFIYDTARILLSSSRTSEGTDR